jgi:hypothetical protein
VHNAFAVPRFLLSSKERHRLELQRCVRIDYRFLWIDLNGFAQAFAADGNPTEAVVMAAQFLAPAESNCSPSGHCALPVVVSEKRSYCGSVPSAEAEESPEANCAC